MAKNKNPREPRRGVLEFWSETGTEGGFWAFQNEKFIKNRGTKNEQWSYDGLHVLENGDRLTIYDKNDLSKIVWRGVINLKHLPLFTEDAYGYWIHDDQIGIARRKWARWFIENYPAILIPAKKKD